MNYPEALGYLAVLADNYERGAPAPYTPEAYNLRRVRALLSELGDPQSRYPAALIAGTKGKGSTAAMAAAILRCTGLRVGLYTSPHLHTVRERITVDGAAITPDAFARGVAVVREAIAALGDRTHDLAGVTTYEAQTALALHHFATTGVDVAVLEVGLGGRLDATNVVEAAVAAITPISYDHTHLLGSTLAAIAAEKAGIVKRRRPCVSAPQPLEALAVIGRVCAEREAPLYLVGESGARWVDRTIAGLHASYQVERLALVGEHQRINAVTAVTIAELLQQGPLPGGAVAGGLASVRWPGRFEVVTGAPTVVLDGAHNGHSAEVLGRTLREQFPDRTLVLVLGTSADKDIAAIVAPLAPLATAVVVTTARHGRAAAPDRVAAAVHALPSKPLLEIAPTVAVALERARTLAGREGVVCVTGSLFVVAEARVALGLVAPTEIDP